MKVIGVVCSPRARGNTELLIEEALDAARVLGADVEICLAGVQNIAPCDGCDTCMDTFQCHLDDDMQPLYTRIKEADGIIFGSPVYSWGVSAQAKAIIDRLHLFRPKRDLTGKVAGAIVVAKTRGETSALHALLGWFTSHRMVVAAAATAKGHEKGEVKANRLAIAEARRVGRAVAILSRVAPPLLTAGRS